jgi:hypothetical protein
MDSDSCGTCRYYVDEACHRYPPQAWGTKGTKKADEVLWPATEAFDWCGEFKQASEPAPQPA